MYGAAHTLLSAHALGPGAKVVFSSTASAIDFICASLSQTDTRFDPRGSKVNSAVSLPSNGFTNSSLNQINSFTRLSGNGNAPFGDFVILGPRKRHCSCSHSFSLFLVCGLFNSCVHLTVRRRNRPF